MSARRSQLLRADRPAAVLVEHHEHVHELLLGVTLVHLPEHHGEKLGKVDLAVAVGVDLAHHRLQLLVSGFLTERPHHVAELLGGDGPAAVLVEDGEGVLKLLHLAAREVRPLRAQLLVRKVLLAHRSRASSNALATVKCE